MEDCVFCKIVSGKIPVFRIYEDGDYLAFLDQSPLVEGHTLVIPKAHYRWVWDLPVGRQDSPNIGQYFEIVKKIANHFQEKFSDDLVTCYIAGIDVSHAHIHLLPKPYALNLPLDKLRGKLIPEKAKELVEKLKF